MAHMKKIGVRVEADLGKKLQVESKKSGASQAELVRRALRKHLK